MSKLRRMPLLQSYDYVRASCAVNHHRARWGLIMHENQEAGLVQIQEAGLLGNAIHALILDRGPLWFEGFGSTAHWDGFLRCMTAEFPRRFGRKRRFLLEMEDSLQQAGLLQKYGLKPISGPSYQTIWLDLTRPEHMLRENLNKKWRNALSKAEKSEVKILWDSSGANFDWLLKVYAEDRQKKNYDGPSIRLLQAMQKTFSPGGNMLIGKAILEKRPIAAILILCHSPGATYQIGWTSREGRTYNSHHQLLWGALSVLKKRSVKDFDLGGVNDHTASGIKKFKTGMGGDLVTLPGIFS